MAAAVFYHRRMSEHYWYRLHFKLKLHEVEGNAFQRLASDILHGVFPGFVPVAPAGRLGDGGNDGFVPSEGRYFQVYGPQAGSSQQPAGVVRKAQQDFAKLRTHYPDVRRYSFVYNERYQGAPKGLLDALEQMQRQTGVACDVLASRDLEDLFMKLPEDKRQAILHGVPVALPEWVDPRAVGEVLQHLADAVARPNPVRERAPDFEAKIAFNNLPSMVADRLRAMSYQASMVDDFLAARSQHLAQAIAEELRALYETSKERFGGDAANAPALRYLWLIEQLVPPQARAHPHALKAYREAAEVVLAKYFESCDIYEQPGAGRLAP